MAEYLEKDTSPKRRPDDVQSLDSWSDIIPDSPNSDEVKTKQKHHEMLLNPSKLATITEPPECRRTHVKLNKSPSTSDTGIYCGSKFFMVPDNISEERTTSPLKMKQTKHAHISFDNDINHHVTGSLIFTDSKSEGNLPDLVKKESSQCYDCETQPRSLEPSFGSSSTFLKSPQKQSHLHNLLNNRQRTSHNDLDSSDIDQADKMKNKLMSVWNNVKYGWTLKTQTNFQKDSPIFLLGSCYTRRPDDADQEPGEIVQEPHCMELFKLDFQSRLWFTYRRGFMPLCDTKFTTDCGWGCMLRSSQMMLAQAFVTHFLGRDWRVHHQTKDQETFYRTIIQWFGDSPSDQCPFSIHRLAEIGKSFGKQPGEWYGPSSVAYILRDALHKAAMSQPVLKQVCMYVAQDCTVYEGDIELLCSTRHRNLTTSSESSPGVQSRNGESSSQFDFKNKPWSRSVIILIPVRLGGEHFNPVYAECVKNLMAQECCLGLIGGKPKHSLYFIGWQDDKLIHLDPHFCQDYVDMLKRGFKIESYHCFTPRKISLRKIDPSATVGFYCRTREEFHKFKQYTQQMVAPNKFGAVYPMFVFNEGKGSDLDINDMSLSMEKSVRIRRVVLDKYGRVRSSTVDSEEFVVL